MKCKELVIDASVARSSGGPEAVHPTAKAARDFLLTTLATHLKIVMTPAIRAEWDKHQSKFARSWRSSMVARKKLSAHEPEERKDLREKIVNTTLSKSNSDAMTKDFHLIEAAITTDKRIIALDDNARDLFAKVSSGIAEIREVLWLNPGSHSAEVNSWLKDGAPNNRKWWLYPVSNRSS